MMQHLMNEVKKHAQLMIQRIAKPRIGIVTAYDPGNYMVKLLIQPEGVETGWLPVKSEWVGNGWGLFAPPSINDQVEIQFEGGSTEAGMSGQRFFTDQARPLGVQSGEFWLVHKSGSALKFHNDGTVDLVTSSHLNATVGGNLNATVGGNLSAAVTGTGTLSAASWNVTGACTWTGNFTLAGNFLSSGTISDLNGSHGDIGALRAAYDNHNHLVTGVQSGGSTVTSNGPNITV